MSKGKKKLSLRDLTRMLPSSDEDKKRIESAIGAESDLVVAIVQTVGLDIEIERAIVWHLARQDTDTIELLCKDNGPFGTFFSKIVLAYAMGVYDAEIMEYAHVIRRIRNAFAHSRKDISFATPEIREEFATLKLPRDKDSDRYKQVNIVRRLMAVQEIGEAPPANDLLVLTGRAAFAIVYLMVQNAILRHRLQMHHVTADIMQAKIAVDRNEE